MRIRHPLRSSVIALGLVPQLILSACGTSTEQAAITTGVGTGGSGNTAGATALSYADAFPQDRVRRLDITVTTENWQQLLADMTDMLGAFGSGANAIQGAAGAGTGSNPPPMGIGQAGAAAMGMPPWGGQGGIGSLPPGGFAGGLPQPGGNAMGLGSVDLIPRTPIYVECDITSEDVTLHHVGVRFKGNSSLAMPWQQGNWKLPLRLKFDEFESTYPETKNQRYFGFQNLSLSNGQADASLMRDKIGNELFARAGLASSASAFYRIYVDRGDGPVYFGLYTAIELPKEVPFLEKHFASHDGNLYKPDGTGARFETYDEATLEKENNATAADYGDVRELYAALHADRSDAAAWGARLEAGFDVDVFLHWLALNTVAEDWDTYGQMSHNFYLYADPNSAGRLTWIPWDHSYVFNAGPNTLSLEMAEVTDSWPLIRYLLDNPRYVETYRNFVAQAATEEYTSDWATARFQSAHDLIQPYVTGESGEIADHGFVTSAAAFNEAAASLIAHVAQRQDDVTRYLAR